MNGNGGVIAAVVLLACTLSLQSLRDKPAAQNSPGAVDVGLTPKPADAVEPADAVSKVRSQSTAGALM